MAITKVTEGVRTLGTGEVATANMATDPTNASNLSSGSVPLAQLGNVDTSGLEDDIAILGFKVASNGSLAKYDLVDQTVDDFQDASGVDASASTNEVRDATGKYYSGTVIGSVTAKTSSGTFTPSSTGNYEILVVAGGGGGGSGAGDGGGRGGGGGGGGVVHDSSYALTSGVEYDLTVGTGGGGGTGSHPSYTNGASGVNSVWNVNAEGSGSTMTALGGGGGGKNGGIGQNGGSGGGGGKDYTGGDATQGDSGGGTGYGFDGGKPLGTGSGGGGGGAAAVGAAGGSDSTGGAGKLFSNFTDHGVSGYFAGGGGGGRSDGNASGGSGGGGQGGNNGTPGGNTAGTANTGGGGGGGSNSTGSDGGSGVILIKDPNVYNDMTLISTSTTAEAVPTKGDIVFTIDDNIGTATINTDVKAYISRDNGTTYTQFTLTDEGATGGHNILTSHDLDISAQPSGTSMRYKIETLNQSISKATFIQAVSLGWS